MRHCPNCNENVGPDASSCDACGTYRPADGWPLAEETEGRSDSGSEQSEGDVTDQRQHGWSTDKRQQTEESPGADETRLDRPAVDTAGGEVRWGVGQFQRSPDAYLVRILGLALPLVTLRHIDATPGTIAPWVWAVLGFAVLVVRPTSVAYLYARAADRAGPGPAGPAENVASALERALKSVPSILLADLIKGIVFVFALLLLYLVAAASMFAFIFFGLPVLLVALYVAVKLSLASAAIVLDGKGPFDGLVSSWNATGGHVGGIFGIVAAFGVIRTIFQQVFGIFGTPGLVLTALVLPALWVIKAGALAGFYLGAR